MTFKAKNLKNIFIYISLISIAFSAFVTASLNTRNVYGQDAPPTPTPIPTLTPTPPITTPTPTATPTPSTIVTGTVNMMVGSEIIEVIEVKNSSDELLANARITVTVNDPDIASIRILDTTINDQVVVEGRVLVAQAGVNGQKAFVISALLGGPTTIDFEALPENGDQTMLVTETLSLEVLQLQAVIQSDLILGEAPLAVQFFDRSLGKIDKRVWKFEDDDSVTTDRNPLHTFTDTGIFDVSLEIESAFSIGTITSAATTTICVTPSDVGLPGVIFGTVIDPDRNKPLSGVDMLLISESATKRVRTQRDGLYRFEGILPGTLNFNICKGPLYECIFEEFTFDGASLIKNFQMERKDFSNP